MNYFDTFDENGTFLCSEDEADVHYKGLWHKVIRIWLYDTEGNLYLRVRKNDKKLDCINELHMLSSESISSCFDRGMFEKLGIHLPATSNIDQAYQKKIKIHKVFSDNSELKDNYFLCDFIGEFDKSAGFFIFSKDTEGLVKVNAKGILNLLSTRTGEVIAYNVIPGGVQEKETRFIAAEDIFSDINEDVYAKFSKVIESVSKVSEIHARERREAEKMNILANKTNELEDFASHADDNEGNNLY